MTLPIISRIIAQAAASGSTAKTPRGAIRYVLATRQRAYCAPLFGGSRRGPYLPPRRFLPAQRAASRYRDDAAMASDLLTIPADSRDWPEWLARRAFVEEGGASMPPLEMIGMQILDIDDATADRAGAHVCRRGTDWYVTSSARPTHTVHEDGATEWRNGRPRAYTRATNTTYVRAVGAVVRRTLVAIVHETHVRIPSPKGYRWDVDALGIRLVSRANRDDDLHVDASDALLSAPQLVAKLERNREARRVAAAESAAESAAYVRRADSIEAGNCSAGTDAWIRASGLDPARSYPARYIRKLANGNPRAILAVRQAAKRHVAEMSAGVCTL